MSALSTQEQFRVLCTALYAFAAAGGDLHITTDDGNVEDAHLEFCREEVKKNEYGYPAAQLAIENAILDLLTPLTVEQREQLMIGMLEDTSHTGEQPNTGPRYEKEQG
jgi:hypothetical protein